MSHELMITDAYKHDLDALPPDIRKKMNKAHKHLEQDPRHPGLYTKEFDAIQKRQVFRSRVDNNYRIVWWYMPDRRIVLWRVGPHSVIDALGGSVHFPEPIQPLHEPAAVETGRPAVWEGAATPMKAGEPIFKHFTLAQLRLLGVPENRVEHIHRVTDFEEIYDLGLPDYALINLESVYTNADWSPEHLFDTRHIFYRANAARLEAYCAGKIRQLMLELHPDQQRLVGMKASGPVLIKGVAGSGKTTVGVYRAIEVARQHNLFTGQHRVLFITYTRTLQKVVQQLFSELCGDELLDKNGQPRIEVVVLHDWLEDLLHRNGCSKILKPDEAGQQLTKAIYAVRQQLRKENKDHPLLKVGNDFFQVEIAHVIKGRGLLSWDAYRTTKRTGRGRKIATGPLEQIEDQEMHQRTLVRPRADGRLLESDRHWVWQVYEYYDQLMREANLMEYADLSREALELMRQGRMKLPHYTEIIVDEAQDLPPMDLRFISALAGSRTARGLVLLADANQSIYYRGISWKDGDIQIVPSRVFSLRRNFRNTRPILETAWSLAQADPLGVTDEIITPQASDRPGKKPMLIGCPSEDHEVKCVKDIVLWLCERMDYRPGDIAVLARRNELVSKVYLALGQVGIPAVHFRDKTFDIFENQVKTITMNSAKGLEFPVVILIGINDRVIPRSGLPSDRERLNIELSIERNLLYVGLTRAAERLYVVYTTAVKSPFLNDLAPEYIEMKAPTDFAASA